MARGFIYYITRNEKRDVDFKEEDYYDKLDEFGIDYVENQTKETSEIPLMSFQKLMQKMGAVTGYGYDDKGFAFSFRFENAQKVKEKHFQPKLDKFKAETAALTLSDVIREEPGFDFNNSYGDMVAFNDVYTCEMSLDDFIRKLESNATYYVYEKVILMH